MNDIQSDGSERLPSSDQKIVYSEESVPLAGIEEIARDVIELYGGTVMSAGEGRVDFSLPRRRGVAASGHVAAAVSWAGNVEGTVTISTGEELMLNRGQRIALLVAGTIGASLFIMWPYFPGMGPVAWIGAMIAIGTYLLTLKKTQHGVVFSMLEQIVDRLVERNEGGDGS